MRARPLSCVGLLLLLAVAFVLRLAPLGRYVTPDEPAWVYRSIRFKDAVAAGDWHGIPDTGHPGVTTMWLGAAGVAGREWVAARESQRHLEWVHCLAWLAPENGEAFGHLAPFLSWGRTAVALVTSLGLGALFWLVGRLIDRRGAALMVGLLALDPFLIGHSGLLHTDALLATFSALTLVTALIALREPEQRGWWLLCGALAGLSLLTKTPGLLLLPFVLALLVIHRLWPAVWGSAVLARPARRVVVDGALLTASSLVVFIVLFPALWSDPAVTLRGLFAFAGSHVEVVQRPIFFAGRMTYDPGPLFYVAVLLLRASPWTLVGVVAGLVLWRRLPSDRRFAFLTSVAFVVAFGTAMSFGAKKHDRYLLPAFPPLTLAAVLGISTFLEGNLGSRRRMAGLSIVVLQGLFALVFATYPLGYFNPLLGGPSVASGLLPVGWGEGASVAARRLNQLPDADELTVATDDVPSLASLFRGRTVSLSENPERVHLSDYVVVGSDAEQFGGWPVLESIRVPGGQRTLVYTNAASYDQEDYLTARVGEGDLILLDADTPLLRRYDGPGTLVSGASLVNEIAVTNWLQERTTAHDTIWLVSSRGASPITASLLRRQLEAMARAESSISVSSAVITQFAFDTPAAALQSNPHLASFDGQLVLIEGALPYSTAWPETLALTLRWQAQVDNPVDYQARAVLVDQDGYAWATAESVVRDQADIPTSCWDRETWSDVVLDLRLPPGIPPGAYAAEVSLYDRAMGAMLGAVGPDGDFRGTRIPVGETRVERPTEAVDVAALAISERLDISVGPLTLLGMNSPPPRVTSGEYVSLELFWRADAPPQTDYDVSLQWVDSDDQVALEVIAPLSPFPTSQWRAGDRFRSHHRAHMAPDLPPGPYRLTLSVLDSGDESVGMEKVPLSEIEILPRERLFEVPKGLRQDLDITFGGRIHLCGYHVANVEVSPGETVPLTLCWRATGPVSRADRGFVLFVHLLGPDGLPRGQVDRVPGNGQARTSSWASGQVILDEINLPVAAGAPPGNYRIAVGFYDVAYGDRLQVTDRGGDLSTADQAVLPVEITVQEATP